jgi:hypothetical protein
MVPLHEIGWHTVAPDRIDHSEHGARMDHLALVELDIEASCDRLEDALVGAVEHEKVSIGEE